MVQQSFDAKTFLFLAQAMNHSQKNEFTPNMHIILIHQKMISQNQYLRKLHNATLQKVVNDSVKRKRKGGTAGLQ